MKRRFFRTYNNFCLGDSNSHPNNIKQVEVQTIEFKRIKGTKITSIQAFKKKK